MPSFPDVMDGIVTTKQVIADQLSVEMIASHRAAIRALQIPDDFFFWALDDRKLSFGPDREIHRKNRRFF